MERSHPPDGPPPNCMQSRGIRRVGLSTLARCTLGALRVSFHGHCGSMAFASPIHACRIPINYYQDSGMASRPGGTMHGDIFWLSHDGLKRPTKRTGDIPACAVSADTSCG